jgi:CopA family copper-resistance protein
MIYKLFNYLSLFILLTGQGFAQLQPAGQLLSDFEGEIVHYQLTLNDSVVNLDGKSEVKAMTINGGIPGPVLTFTVGDSAVISVTNNMPVETSVHWHGILLPNFQDGVPYLTTPPIKPGETFTYRFLIKQSGTYWYHSHTMLQEQSGVYGSLVFLPKDKRHEYDKELVVVLSDWTHQQPADVLRNLKRGNEWYQIAKGTAMPLNRVIGRGALGAQLNFWRQRMEGPDIADIYYPSFLSNGKEEQYYPQFKAGEKVRVRIINAAASSQFWLTFGGEAVSLISADGLDVKPYLTSKTFIAIAETYDFIVEIPEDRSIEIRAMVQDGSGHSLTYLGTGVPLKAEVLPRPDKIQMMKQMAKMDMRMGAPAMRLQYWKSEPHEMMQKWGMQMPADSEAEMKSMEQHHSEGEEMKMGSQKIDLPGKETPDSAIKRDHTKTHEDHQQHTMGHSHHMKMEGMQMDHPMNMFEEYEYDFLKAEKPTAFDQSAPRKEVLLNLTGNMWRYIWSMNGIPLNKADKIRVEEGSVLRITLNNLTMMHHPMHLHGHFFRVINSHGEYSPLKHTVNVPPMQKITIEFAATEAADWFFHCHVLYHMMSGMARIYSYDGERNRKMQQLNYPLDKLLGENNHFYFWGSLDAASHMGALNFTASNIRHQFMANMEYGWNENLEAEFTYEYFLYDYLRLFIGTNSENEMEKSHAKISTNAIAGIRFFTPYMFNLDVRIDQQLRPEIRIDREIMIFSRTILFGGYEFQADQGWSGQPYNEAGEAVNFKYEQVWHSGLRYLINRNLSVFGSYDNRFGGGGGLSLLF